MRRAPARERKAMNMCTIQRKERIDRCAPARDNRKDGEVKQRVSKHTYNRQICVVGDISRYKYAGFKMCVILV
jgi:hypothetical protein